MLGGWLVVILVTSVTADITVYGKLGGEVDLKPDGVSVTNKTKDIIWKDWQNIAFHWDGKVVDAYRHFKERAFLNTSTGVMTIKGLVQEDSITYTPEIDNKAGTGVRLIVISSVPVPTISKSQPDPEKREFRLSCDGNTTGAEPVSYTWKADNNVLPEISKKHFNITEASLEVDVFSCEMTNPVSKKSSQPFHNPLKSSLNIFTGVIVFVCLLAPLLLLVIFHRIKAGEWFFQKLSMPWEGEFWRKEVDTTESNWTTMPQLKQDPDEEAMT